MSGAEFWPIFFAGITSVVMGVVWYHPLVFGTSWMRLAGLSPEQMEAGRRHMPLTGGVGFLAAMLIAYVMSYFGMAWGVADWIGALELSIWCWLGFTAPVLLGTVLWEQKPFKLYVINALYWFVVLVVMAQILVR